jgi:phosphate transport system substrate-binding protein
MLVADGDCKAYREDGHVIEGGENDELYVEHITKEQGAFGIFGYSFVSNNSDKVKASMINGVEISMEGIQDYSYPIARPLFFYIKKAHIGVIPGLMDYVNEFVSEEATEGYLLDAGLVQLSPEDRATVLDAISNQTNYK